MILVNLPKIMYKKGEYRYITYIKMISLDHLRYKSIGFDRAISKFTGLEFTCPRYIYYLYSLSKIKSSFWECTQIFDPSSTKMNKFIYLINLIN